MKDYSEYETSLKSKNNKSEKKEKKRIKEKDRSKGKLTDKKKTLPKKEITGTKARVLSVSSTEVIVDLNGEETHCSLRGVLKKDKGDQKHILTIGDFVIIDERGQVAQVVERYSELARRDNLRRRKAHVIAANIDQVLITTSVHEPNLKPSLIDRYIIAAKRGNMQPVLIVNKIDLMDNKKEVNEIIKIYEDLEVPVIGVCAIKQKGLKKIEKIMKGKASVFSGQSGVGKTTLINYICGTDFRTGEVVESTQKGCHTTTKSELIKIDADTFCIDTPGIKSFSLWDVTSEELATYFSDLHQYASACKFDNCTHTHEPHCGVRDAVEDGKIPAVRYESYITIRDSNDKDQKDHWA